MEKRPHFKATITYLSSEDGGIAMPVSSGYRTSIKFPYQTTEILASQTFLDEDLVFPGDTVSADILLINAGDIIEKIYAGIDFDLVLNSATIGNGVVTEIYD